MLVSVQWVLDIMIHAYYMCSGADDRQAWTALRHFCDNATNFVGACFKFQDLKDFLFDKTNQQEITSYCTKEFENFHTSTLWRPLGGCCQDDKNRPSRSF